MPFCVPTSITQFYWSQGDCFIARQTSFIGFLCYTVHRICKKYVVSVEIFKMIFYFSTPIMLLLWKFIRLQNNIPVALLWCVWFLKRGLQRQWFESVSVLCNYGHKIGTTRCVHIIWNPNLHHTISSIFLDSMTSTEEKQVSV